MELREEGLEELESDNIGYRVTEGMTSKLSSHIRTTWDETLPLDKPNEMGNSSKIRAP